MSWFCCLQVQLTHQAADQHRGRGDGGVGVTAQFAVHPAHLVGVPSLVEGKLHGPTRRG